MKAYPLAFRTLLMYSILSVPLFAYSQEWTWQNPLPQGNPLHSIKFVDAHYGWAVGEFGTIIRTTDGGFTWGVQSSGTENVLQQVIFVNRTVGWALNSKEILLTTDGGTIWRKQEAPTKIDGASFTDEKNGWVVGLNNIFHTTNGGNTWIPQYDNKHAFRLTDVSFVNSKDGYAVGRVPNRKTLPFDISTVSVILWTTNSGVTWKEHIYEKSAGFNNVVFRDKQNGWIVGYKKDETYNETKGLIIFTTNSGTTWNEIDPSNFPKMLGNIYNVFSSSKKNIWISTDWGSYRTTNNGETWLPSEKKQLVKSPGIVCASFIGSKLGWAVQRDEHQHYANFTDKGAPIYGYQSIRILHTTNGGESWESPNDYLIKNLTSVAFTDSNNGWAVGVEGTILHTANGGARWESQNSGTSNDLLRVVFVNKFQGWAIGECGTIAHTSDGGKSWIKQYSGTNKNLRNLAFADSNNGWAIGDENFVPKSSFGHPGLHRIGLREHFKEFVQRLMKNTRIWRYLPLEYCIEWFSFPEESHILQTTNGGNTWNIKIVNDFYSVTCVACTDAKHVWIGGTCGTYLCTTNGGENWETKQLGNYTNIASIAFTDSMNGWIYGNDICNEGLVFPEMRIGNNITAHTTNGGKTWECQPYEVISKTANKYHNNWYGFNFNNVSKEWTVNENFFHRKLFRLVDGRQWEEYSSVTSNLLFDVCFLDSDHGWAVGQGGTILRYSKNRIESSTR